MSNLSNWICNIQEKYSYISEKPKLKFVSCNTYRETFTSIKSLILASSAAVSLTFSAGYWSPQSWRRSWRRLARSDQFCHAGGQTLAAGLREGLDRLKFEQQIWSAVENLFNLWATERALVLRSLDDLRSGCKKDRFFYEDITEGEVARQILQSQPS